MLLVAHINKCVYELLHVAQVNTFTYKTVAIFKQICVFCVRTAACCLLVAQVN